MNLATQETSPTGTYKGATTQEIQENNPHGIAKVVITQETSPKETFMGVIIITQEKLIRADLMKVHTEITENPQGADQEIQRGGTMKIDTVQEEDQEIEETVTVIEAENHLTQGKDQTVGIVGTTQDHPVGTDQKHIDLRTIEMKEMEEIRDTTPKMTEEVSMAMVAGAEKSARRP